MSESVKVLLDLSMSEISATTKEEIGFDEAFTLHHRTVFRCARAVVNDSGLAEDIVQEVFLKLYSHMDDIKDQEMLRPWLIRVTINLSRNALRGNFRANVREENYVKETDDGHIAYSPEVDYEQRLQVEEIRRTLDKVKEPMRSCLILKQQGLSYKEIAESLDINETSVGTYVARARKEFIRYYGKIGRDA